jgi:hypothetical protein
MPPRLPYPQGQGSPLPPLQPINPEAMEYLKRVLGAESILSLPQKLAKRVSMRDLAHYALGEYHLIPPARRDLVRAVFELYRPSPLMMSQMPFDLSAFDLLPTSQDLGMAQPSQAQEEEEQDTGWWSSLWRNLYALTTTLAYSPIALAKSLTFGTASAVLNTLGLTPENVRKILQDLNPNDEEQAPYYAIADWFLKVHEAGGSLTENISSFYRERLKSSVLEDLISGASIVGAFIPIGITGAVATTYAGLQTGTRMLGSAIRGENPFTNKNFVFAIEPLMRTFDAHTRLFTKEGKFWDTGTQLLRYQNAQFPLNAPLATDNKRVLIKTKTGRVYEREIPIVELEAELERLRATFPEVKIVSDDPIKSPLSFSLFGKTINPFYAFGLGVELFMPFPTKGFSVVARTARGATRLIDEFAYFARRAFAPLSEGAKLSQRAEALAELVFLPSYYAGGLPFTIATRMLGKAGVRVPKINIGASGRFAGLVNALNKANEFFFTHHFIPYDLGSGYNASLHRLWDRVMTEARREGIKVLERNAVNNDLRHFLNAPAEEVLAKLMAEEGGYHPLLRHILQREGITAERVATDLFGARRAIFSKYGDEMSLFAYNLHSSQMRLSIGRGLARANLAVGDAVQRMSAKGITRWLYPAWGFQDTVHHLTSFGTTLATAMQGRLQVMERTGAEMIRGLTGDPAFRQSALFQAHRELSELRNLIRAQYGDPNTPLAEGMASLTITDIDKALEAGERFITQTGILPDTPTFARLFARNENDLPLLQDIIDIWQVKNLERLSETGQTLTPEEAWAVIPKPIRDKVKLLKSEAEALYRWFEGTTPEEQMLALGILGRGADLTDAIGQYFLKAKALRGLGFTPQALDELVEHFNRVERKIGLTPDQRLKFQGLLYRLLQNKIFSPDELAEARRFLQDIGIPADQIDDMLSAFQAGRSLLDAQELAFGYTRFEIERFLQKLRDGREAWEQAFLKSAQEHFPDCLRNT